MQPVNLCFVDGIFLQHTRSATAVTQTEYSTVDVHEGGIALLQLVVVADGSDVRWLVMKGREGERLLDGRDTDGMTLSVSEDYLRTVFMIATVLRTGVMGVLLGDGALITTNWAGGLTVGVVLPGSSTVPAQLLVALR